MQFNREGHFSAGCSHSKNITPKCSPPPFRSLLVQRPHGVLNNMGDQGHSTTIHGKILGLLNREKTGIKKNIQFFRNIIFPSHLCCMVYSCSVIGQSHGSLGHETEMGAGREGSSMGEGVQSKRGNVKTCDE